jgi:polysaccharide pyruvyl transferase CsaB
MKIVLLGYYGFDNLGDEAVLAGILQTIKPILSANNNREIIVLSNNPEKTIKMHMGVQAVSRWDKKAVWNALTNTDIFIFGGGSLLQDATSVKSVIWYALVALLARKKSKKVLWWGQGIGPLSSPLSRLLVKIIANQADAITVRDEKSAQLLKEIGVSGSIETVADPAFALSVTPCDLANRHGVFFAPREWQSEMDKLAEVLAIANGIPGVEGGVTGLPMHLPHDREYLERLGFGESSVLYNWEGQSLETVLARVAQSEMMISVRLHSLIFAARAGVPFVALSYDPKIIALAEQAGQADALLPLDSLDANAFRDTIVRVRETQAVRTEQLVAFSERQALLAQRPGEILKGWLE